MKNVTEIRKFARRLLNDSSEVIQNGVSDIGTVLSKVIGLIQPGRDAYEDAAKYFPELAQASNDDMDQSVADVQGLLNSFSEKRQRDINAIEEGVVAVTRIVADARQEGIIEGRAQLAFELRELNIDWASLDLELTSAGNIILQP